MESSGNNGMVYVVVVTGKLKPGQLPQFIENFKPLAQHVQKHEEGALTYQLSTGGDDPDRLCIFERSGPDLKKITQMHPSMPLEPCHGDIHVQLNQSWWLRRRRHLMMETLYRVLMAQSS